MLTAAAILIPTVLLCGYCYHRSVRRDVDPTAQSPDPDSLPPVIDKDLCGGCGSCVEACPENGVLDLVAGKVEVVGPERCQQHAACATVCPLGAIHVPGGRVKTRHGN